VVLRSRRLCLLFKASALRSKAAAAVTQFFCSRAVEVQTAPPAGAQDRRAFSPIRNRADRLPGEHRGSVRRVLRGRRLNRLSLALATRLPRPIARVAANGPPSNQQSEDSSQPDTVQLEELQVIGAAGCGAAWWPAQLESFARATGSKTVNFLRSNLTSAGLAEVAEQAGDRDAGGADRFRRLIGWREAQIKM